MIRKSRERCLARDGEITLPESECGGVMSEEERRAVMSVDAVIRTHGQHECGFVSQLDVAGECGAAWMPVDGATLLPAGVVRAPTSSSSVATVT